MEPKRHFEKKEVKSGGFGSRLKDSIYLGKKSKLKKDLEKKKESSRPSFDPLGTEASDETKETTNDIPDKVPEEVMNTYCICETLRQIGLLKISSQNFLGGFFVHLKRSLD